MPGRKCEHTERTSLSLPSALLRNLDVMIREKGGHNRSQIIADMIRERLVEHQQQWGQQEIIGAITLVYDHHKRDLQKQMTEIQHHHHHAIIATTHVHLDHHNCLEMIAVRGKAAEVRKVADGLIGLKGVTHGRLTVSTTGKDLTR